MIFGLVLWVFSQSSFGADLKPIQIKLGDKIATHRNVNELSALRAAYATGKLHECLKLGAKAESKWPELQAWIALLQLRCVNDGYAKDQKKFSAALARLTTALWKNPEWLFFGGPSRKLRFEAIEANLLLIESDLNSNRIRAWKHIDQLLEVKEWLDNKQKARLYRFCGELSFAQQKLIAARDYYARSLREEANTLLQARFEALSRDVAPKSATTTTAIKLNAEIIESTPEELHLFNSMKEGLKNGDLLSAVEDGVKLMRDYPGSKRAGEAAKNILNVYLGLAMKSEEKFNSLKDRVLAQMRKVDGQRLYEWAQTLVLREKFIDAVSLAKGSLELIGGQPLSTKVLMLAANSSYQSADFKSAQEYYEKVVKEHAGTAAAAEAIFRLGLLEFRREKYAEAANHFERFLQLEFNSDFELSSLYWLWRSQQKLQSPKAVEAAEKLIHRYPVSYYGLRARAELNQNRLGLEKMPSRVPEWTFFLTAKEEGSWEKFLILNKAGWIEEAQIELNFLEEPLDPEGKVIVAYLWGQAGEHYKASEILNRAFSLDSSLVSLATVQIAYPQNYREDIMKEAARYNIPLYLVQALIKQESSFRIDVKSPAGALGLMQLMPVTAREVAGDMRIKITDLATDLTVPNVNIRIGTQYLHRRLKVFEGHVPLALSAYNAGIGNVRNWLQARKDLIALEKNIDQDPLREIWFDELPWPETSGYIKSILRNYLIYKLLDLGEFDLTNPVWKIPEKV